jgi:hypothetical protein
MLKRSYLLVLLVTSVFALSACKDEVTAPTGQMSEQQSVQKSLSSVQSNLISVNRIKSNDDGLWEVKVITPSGAFIKFEYFESTSQIREIHGLTGPFDYDLNPGNDLLFYQDVRVIALNAKSGNITSWKLEKDESDNRWEYRFFITANDGNWELRINALNGQILRIKQN